MEQPAARAIDPSETYDLRGRVLRPGAAASELDFAGDHDPDTLHVGAELGGQVVAIGSIYREARASDAPGAAPRGPDHDAGTAWRLRGMATDPAARRAGAGRAALDLLVEHVRREGGTLAWCNARIGAVEFYEAAGWVRLGELFELEGIGPHYVMELQLA